MTENDVRVIVTDDRDAYEREVGLPRHMENLANFARIFSVLNKGAGVMIAVGVIVGIPAVIASIITIVKFAKGI